MTLKVHHYFPLGSDNIGDHLVARAIRGALARHFGAIDFVNMPVNDRYRAGDRTIGLLGNNVDRSNREADMTVIGGSNLLEPRRLRKNAAGRPAWGVFTDKEAIDRLTTPLMLIGMGTGSDFGRPVPDYAPQAAEQVRLLHQKAFATAVRDPATVDQLATIGVETICTGCPVTFLTDRPVAAADPKLPLIVSLPPHRILRRLKGRFFMRQAMDYIAWLRRRGVPIVVTLHEHGDIELADRLLPPGVERFHTDDLEELIDRYERSQGVIGFRLHAALLGLGLGKPVIPVGVDWRGQAFLETFGLEKQSIRPAWFGEFTKLKRLTDQLLDGDEAFVSSLDSAKTKFRKRYDGFLADAAVRFSALKRG
jgi:polysaccharide pyruvyl transferase WcaK-like protein